MEVRCLGNGYTLVNSLPLERYLQDVVPSEMPASYEPEALKAQAVCARSYACIQLLRGDLAEYGAHIDDSTAYQVYNRVTDVKAAREAVIATQGKCCPIRETSWRRIIFPRRWDTPPQLMCGMWKIRRNTAI